MSFRKYHSTNLDESRDFFSDEEALLNEIASDDPRSIVDYAK